MIEVSFLGLAVFFICVAVSSLSGILLSSALPWSDNARATGLACATGVALGPFIFGFGSILSLGFLRGGSHDIHLAASLAFVAIIAAVGYLKRGARIFVVADAGALSLIEWSLCALIVGVVSILLFVVLFVPLVQNDALEYAIAAREIYWSRDLFGYPILNATENSSGFYGPWTHPPLYVALLYMANVIQGDATSPGMIRFISPWFMLCGAWLIYALGAYANRLMGLLACLFFLMPPLFFLGAGFSLIDALPILGVTLTMAVLLGLRTKPVVYGAIVGSILGIALWTHSQAIVFIFLSLAMVVVRWGLCNIKAWLCAACGLILMTALIAVWPYWHNIQVLGAAVSDNPAVFALPSLYWSEYFSIGRGLGNTPALLQYGLLKAWFAPESYGFIFWGMMLGIVFFLSCKRNKKLNEFVWSGITGINVRDELLCLSTGFFVIYMLGMLASIVLGIEHMVKNERYLLVMLPAAALLCAYGCKKISDMLAKRAEIASGIFFVLLAVACVAHMGVMFKYSVSKISPDVLFTQSMSEKNEAVPEIQLAAFLDSAVEGEGIVLSLKPADMYYASRRMISYLDERLLPFYGKTDMDAAYDELLALDVGYIHLPNYGIPPIYNSKISALVRSTFYATLLYQTAAGQVYALKPAAQKEVRPQDISPKEKQWVLQDAFSIGGRKIFMKFGARNTLLEGAGYQKKNPYGLFHRHLFRTASVGVSLPSMLPSDDSILRVEPSTEYAFDLRLEGAGFLEISVDQFSKKEGGEEYELIKHTEITSFELSKTQVVRDYGFRFLTLPTAQAIALNIRSMGDSEVHIMKAVQSKLVHSTEMMH